MELTQYHLIPDHMMKNMNNIEILKKEIVQTIDDFLKTIREEMLIIINRIDLNDDERFRYLTRVENKLELSKKKYKAV